jgi:protoporphyrinogen oxidase
MVKKNKIKIAIIGGGLSGLTTAWELVKKGHKVVVFEKETQVGGLAKSFKNSNWLWSLDQFYRHVFAKDTSFISLVKELGQKDELFFKKPKTSLYLDNKIYPFDSPIDVLKFSQLSLISRLHLGLGTAVMKFLPYSDRYEKVTIEKLTILVGKEAYNKVWLPLIIQKFGKQWRQIPLSWFWARIRSRTPSLGYFKNSFSRLIDVLLKNIKLKGGEVKTNQDVTRLEKNSKSFLVYSNKKKYKFDKIILATPMPISLTKFDNLLKIEKKKYSAVKMIGSAVLVLELTKKFLPKNTYWLNVLEKKWPFVAVVEQTNFIDRYYYGGNPVVYLGGYYSWDNPIYKMRKKEVEKLFLPFAEKINPLLKKSIIDSKFFTNLFSQPVTELNQSKKVPQFKTSTPGLYWITMNHIYPWDRGMNYSVKYAKLLAKQLIIDNKK